MKSKNLCAALVAGLILALGLSLLPAKAMAMNEDVEFLNPPSTEAGDPDTGGQFWTFAFGSSQASALQLGRTISQRLVSIWRFGQRVLRVPSAVHRQPVPSTRR
jgi:hypothetical protein